MADETRRANHLKVGRVFEKRDEACLFIGELANYMGKVHPFSRLFNGDPDPRGFMAEKTDKRIVACAHRDQDAFMIKITRKKDQKGYLIEVVLGERSGFDSCTSRHSCPFQLNDLAPILLNLNERGKKDDILDEISKLVNPATISDSMLANT